MTVQVADRAGVPADASSVVLNVTAVAPRDAGHLTVHPTGTSRPNASNVNYSPGQTVANTVIARVGTGGSVSIYTHAATHLVVDIAGHFPAGNDTLLPAPRRLVDTRPGAVTFDGQDAGTGQRPAGSTMVVRVADRAGIPADASSVVLNVTAVAPRGPGHLTVHPTGTPRPNASNVNYSPAHTTSNTVIARVGTGGSVSIFAFAATHLVVDIAGRLPTDTYTALPTPLRLADTRPDAVTSDGQQAGTGLVPGGGSLQLRVAGRAGVPADASSVVLNVTAVAPLGPGHLTVHPTGTARPNASNVNYSPAHTTSNTVIARLGAGGDTCAFTHTTTHLVIDIAGYLSGPPPPPAGPTCPPVTYGSPKPLGTEATLSDINNAGILVGGADVDSDGYPEAAWWPTPDGGPQPVPGVPGDAQSSHATSVNDRNQVLVSVWSGASDSDLLVIDLSSGHVAQLPDLEDVPALEGVAVSRPQPAGLNDRGEVVLNLVQGSHDPEGIVAVWKSATGVVVTHPEFMDVSWANDINDLGHVVGVTHGDRDHFDGFYWDLDTNIVHWVEPGGFGIAWPRGVNDRGQIVGDSGSSPTFWPDRDAAPVLLSGSFGSHWLINEAGLVVGRRPSSDPTGWDMPAIWDTVSGQWLEFPIQWPGSIHAMNDVGQVIGSTGAGQPAIWHPV